MLGGSATARVDFFAFHAFFPKSEIEKFMVGERGGDEDFAGAIISTATLGTLAFVTFSGHCADLLGLSKSVALAAFFLTLSMLGFVLSDGLGFDLLLYGFLLGVGWGVFYVLMPIVLAVIVKPEQRVRFFALLSGSLMAGIGTGPLVGRLVSFWLLPIESAFLVACLCSLMGGVLCFCAERNLRKNKDLVPQVARMSARAVGRIVRSPAVFPIVMAGLGGGVFSGVFPAFKRFMRRPLASIMRCFLSDLCWHRSVVG